MSIKYYTLSAVVEPTSANPFGIEYIDTVQIQEEAVNAAKAYAVRNNCPIEVVACCFNPDHNKRSRYHPDGTVEEV